MIVDHLNDRPLLGDNPLADAVLLGHDYAGVVTLEALSIVLRHRRHEIVSAHRIDERLDDSLYEVVLKAKHT